MAQSSGDGSEKLDIYFLVDTTGSMGPFLVALTKTLFQLHAVLRVLFANRAVVHVVTYEDYCDGNKLVRFCDGDADTTSSYCYDKEKNSLVLASSLNQSVSAFVESLVVGGGGDCPEAVKTALNHLSLVLDARPNRRALVVHYTDAPPHHASNGKSDNFDRERALLGEASPGFDWLSICAWYRTRDVPVVTVINNDAPATVAFFALLGSVVFVQGDITWASMAVLLQLMGQIDTAAAPANVTTGPKRLDIPVEHKDVLLNVAVHEANTCRAGIQTDARKSPSAAGRTRKSPLPKHGPPVPNEDTCLALSGLKGCVAELPLSFEPLPYMRADVKALPGLFRADASFERTVWDMLRSVFAPAHVLALTYNPVLGSLWRLCCTRRDDPRLGELRDALGRCVQSLRGDEKLQLEAWVESSFDQTDEISRLIDSVPPLPCLVLDGLHPASLPDKKTLMSIARAPLPGVLAQVQAILTGLLVITTPPPCPSAVNLVTTAPATPTTTDTSPSEHAATERIGAGRAVEEEVRCAGLPRNGPAKMYLPLGMSDRDLFAALPHLVCPGTLFTLRPAAVMAILACVSKNKLLQRRAERFLASIRGKWIGLDVHSLDAKLKALPELVSPEFVKLVCRVPHFLTAPERRVYSRLQSISRARMAARHVFQVRLPYTPTVRETRPDTLVRCSRCRLLRSESITSHGTCGLCLSGSDVTTPTADAATRSALAECCVPWCRGIYAVVETSKLMCRPKCHYCRHGLPAPLAVCSVCHNRFVRPDLAPAEQPYRGTQTPRAPAKPQVGVDPNEDGTEDVDGGKSERAKATEGQNGSKEANKEPEAKFKGAAEPVVVAVDFTCAQCTTDPARSEDAVDVQFDALVASNPHLTAALSIPPTAAPLLFAPLTMFNLCLQHRPAIFHDLLDPNPKDHPATNGTTPPTAAAMDLRWSDKDVRGISALLEQVRAEVLTGSLHDTCMMCFDDKPEARLDSACGRCQTRCCAECLERWYGDLVPGGLVVASHLRCPFCKRSPAPKVLRRYNKATRSLAATLDVRKLRHDMWYGWCMSCNRIAEAVDRECAREAPVLARWQCGDCNKAEAAAFSRCPKCGVATEKAGGCNHITCRCGAHWCFVCGDAFEIWAIYEHLNQVHGGIGLDDYPDPGA